MSAMLESSPCHDEESDPRAVCGELAHGQPGRSGLHHVALDTAYRTALEKGGA